MVMSKKRVDYPALGEKIRQKRLNKGLSQEALSGAVDLSQSFYGHIERGDRKLSVESLVKIADYLDLSMDFLLLESKSPRGGDESLQCELNNIFRDKSQTQKDYLLNILKVLSDSIEKLQKT
jgi:transcriptional regulator with XRE-family HTH domain